MIVPGTRVEKLIKVLVLIVDSEREGIQARKDKSILSDSSSTYLKQESEFRQVTLLTCVNCYREDIVHAM